MSDLDSVIETLKTCKSELGNDDEDRVVRLLDEAIVDLEKLKCNRGGHIDWNEVLLIFGRFLDSIPAIAALMKLIEDTLK